MDFAWFLETTTACVKWINSRQEFSKGKECLSSIGFTNLIGPGARSPEGRPPKRLSVDRGRRGSGFDSRVVIGWSLWWVFRTRIGYKGRREEFFLRRFLH